MDTQLLISSFLLHVKEATQSWIALQPEVLFTDASSSLKKNCVWKYKILKWGLKAREENIKRCMNLESVVGM